MWVDSSTEFVRDKSLKWEVDEWNVGFNYSQLTSLRLILAEFQVTKENLRRCRQERIVLNMQARRWIVILWLDELISVLVSLHIAENLHWCPGKVFHDVSDDDCRNWQFFIVSRYQIINSTHSFDCATRCSGWARFVNVTKSSTFSPLR